MTIRPGTELLHFTVLDKIGEGGMGAVWLADDTTLGRRVAIKVLPQELAGDPERLARFGREAKVLASLNHPNIAAVYGLHHAGDVHFLVMELVDGENLAARIGRGALAIDETVSIALQIAEALEAAHDSGVVHRDLKPANVALTPQGKVKVLDFGLAKALARDGGAGSDPALSPTMTSAGTLAGVILGTAAYMSPEQARGRLVDRRADVWAFGCVLYEMLTGRRLFDGETVSDVLASVLKTDPDWSALPAETPAVLRRVLKRCLERNPERRLAHLSGARVALRELAEGGIEEPSGEPGGQRTSARVPWAVAAVLLLVAVVAAVTAWRRPDADRRIWTLSAAFPPGRHVQAGNQFGVLAIALDARTLAVVLENDEDRSQSLWLRRLDSPAFLELAGTRDASTPFFSPDGKWIAFFADDKLKKVPIEGGSPLTICDSIGGNRGATWTADDRIVFTGNYATALEIVPAAGGRPVALTRLERDRGERTHRWPHAVPGRDLVLFTVGTVESPESYDTSTIDAVRLSTGERRTVLEGASMAWYAPGYLLFARGGFLFAVLFDVESLETHGSPVPVVEDVAGMRSSGVAYAASTPDGTLAYLVGQLGSRRSRLVWRGTDGSVERLPLPVAGYLNPRFSPDRRKFAVEIEGATTFDIWAYDLVRESPTRLTFDGDNTRPAWSPDGTRIAYHSVREADGAAIRVKAADGSGSETTLREGDYVPASWSPDGRALIVQTLDSDQGNLLRLTIDDGAVENVVATPADELDGNLSPDARWLAYASAETGPGEIYVRSYPDIAGKWQISRGGGYAPRWSPDGKRLFYRVERDLWYVDVRGDTGFEAGSPQRVLDDLPFPTVDGNYDALTADRLLFVVPAEPVTPAAGVTVVVNWVVDLERRVPR